MFSPWLTWLAAWVILGVCALLALEGRRVPPTFSDSSALLVWKAEVKSESGGVVFSRDGKYLLEAKATVSGFVGRYASGEYLYSFKTQARQPVVREVSRGREVARGKSVRLKERHWSEDPEPAPDYTLAFASLGPWETPPVRVSARQRQFQKYSSRYFARIESHEFSPDGRLLALGRPNSVEIWNALGTKRLRVYEHAGYHGSVRWGPDSQTVTCFFYGANPHVIDARSARPIRYPLWVYRVMNGKGEKRRQATFAFSRGGEMLAKVGADDSIELWKTPRSSRGHRLKTLRSSLLRIYSLAFSPGNRHLVASGLSATNRASEVFALDS